MQNNSSINPWPPSYKLRQSQRAKRLLLKISAQQGLEVIVPAAYRKPYHIPSLLDEHKSWIETQLLKIKTYSNCSDQLPTHLSLPVLNEYYRLEYCIGQSAVSSIQMLTNLLRLNIQQGSMSEASKVLRRWLSVKARRELPQLLKRYSLEFNLPFNKVTLRWQKTRWGSCNSHKDISLNCGLLLLPTPLLRYVLIHELCHTEHLNHSAKFWQKVAQCDPNWREHKQQLRLVQRDFPAWARC